MYSSIARVRSESWFTNNNDITDLYIEGYINQSNWILIWYIASIFNISNFSWVLFAWSQAENILKRIEELFSSWYLLIAEYWPEARNTDKDWYIKIKEAEGLCNKLLLWEISLFDINWNEYSKKWSAPSWTIVLTVPLNSKAIFSINDKY